MRARFSSLPKTATNPFFSMSDFNSGWLLIKWPSRVGKS
jgi:hypothetical protein